MTGTSWRTWTNFNPLPPHGGRPISSVPVYRSQGFQSTPSAWRETHRTYRRMRGKKYFNPLPPHGGRLCNGYDIPMSYHFNPLPPHGGRRLFRISAWSGMHFNPLPPHGGRPHSESFCIAGFTFQSTPSAWRETNSLAALVRTIYISIHSLRMEGDWCENGRGDTAMTISIHSLRMEGDKVYKLV